MLLEIPTPESPPLDVQELLNRCMGNIELAERVLSKLQSRFDEDMIELELALTRNDGKQIASIAHRLKGAAANVAAHELREAAAKIEEAARQDRLTELPSQLAILRKQWARLNQSSLPGREPILKP